MVTKLGPADKKEAKKFKKQQKQKLAALQVAYAK